MGMRPIVVDGGDDKKKLSLDLGAEHYVDFTKEDVGAKVKEIADGVGAHGVLVTAYQSYKGQHSMPSPSS
jgi:alcohol dehydrogenase, propanol-preferring